MERGSLEGKTILVVEKEPLIALDLQRALEAAGAEVIVTRNAKEAVFRIKKSRFAAGVIDWHPSSEDHRLVARALKEWKVRFLFYATHPPEDVTTVRGAPIFLKPGRSGGHCAGIGHADRSVWTARNSVTSAGSGRSPA